MPRGSLAVCGVDCLQSMVLEAGENVGVLCWSKGFFRVLMCTYLAKQFILCLTEIPPIKTDAFSFKT